MSNCYTAAAETKLIGRLQARRARNNFDELRRNRGLASTVVKQSELGKHFARVLTGVLHRLHSGTQFRGVVFQHGVVEERTHLELGKVEQEFRAVRAFNLVGIERVRTLFRSLFELFAVQARDNSRLEGDGRNESVIDEVRLRGVLRQDAVGDGARRAEGERLLGGVNDNIVDVFRVETRELRPSLITNNVQARFAVVDRLENTRVLDDGGVDTAAETLVGRNRHDDGSLCLSIRRIAQQSHERLNQRTRLFTLRLRPLQTGRGNHLHRLGNLLNVTDGAHANLHRLQRNSARALRSSIASS